MAPRFAPLSRRFDTFRRRCRIHTFAPVASFYQLQGFPRRRKTRPSSLFPNLVRTQRKEREIEIEGEPEI